MPFIPILLGIATVFAVIGLSEERSKRSKETQQNKNRIKRLQNKIKELDELKLRLLVGGK